MDEGSTPDAENPRAPEVPSADTESLTRSAGRGALWHVLNGFATTVVRLGASVVLARVLFPEDFGLVGMALLARGLIDRMGSLGTGTGVIAKEHLTDDDLCTAFWVNLVVKTVLFAVMFLGAPLIAMFFDAPELVVLTRVVSLSFILSGLSGTSSALMRRRLQFGAYVCIQGGGMVVESAMAIFFAVVLGLGYWSLIVAALGAAVLSHTTIILYARWLPQFRFSWDSFRYQFRFGIYGLASSIAGYFEQNIDYLVIGQQFGSAQLGLYQFAYRIPIIIHE